MSTKRTTLAQLLDLSGQTTNTDASILDYCRYTPAGNHTEAEWQKLYDLTTSGSDAEAATENKIAVVKGEADTDQYYDANYNPDEATEEAGDPDAGKKGDEEE